MIFDIFSVHKAYKIGELYKVEYGYRFNYCWSISKYLLCLSMLLLSSGICTIALADDHLAEITASNVHLTKIALSPAEEHSEIYIEVRASSHVNSRKFTLGEIADITAPEFLYEQLALIQMGFAPAPGKIKTANGRRIKAKIKSNKLFSPEMILVVPDTVYVKRASQEISIDNLNSIYEEYVEAHIEDLDYEIRNFSARGLALYPAGKLSLSSPVHKGKNFKGKVTFYINVAVDGRDQGILSLSAWIDIFDEVVSLSRSMVRGTVLTPSDLHVKRMNISNLRDTCFGTALNVVGKVLIRSVRKNKPLTVRMVAEQPLVQRGDMVKIVASRGNLHIVTLGIARNDGKRNDIIQVENMTSGKMINAVVAGKASVNVFY